MPWVPGAAKAPGTRTSLRLVSRGLRDRAVRVHLAVAVPAVEAGTALAALGLATRLRDDVVRERQDCRTGLRVRRLLHGCRDLARSHLPVLRILQIAVTADDQRGDPGRV